MLYHGAMKDLLHKIAYFFVVAVIGMLLPDQLLAPNAPGYDLLQKLTGIGQPPATFATATPWEFALLIILPLVISGILIFSFDIRYHASDPPQQTADTPEQTARTASRAPILRLCIYLVWCALAVVVPTTRFALPLILWEAGKDARTGRPYAYLPALFLFAGAKPLLWLLSGFAVWIEWLIYFALRAEQRYDQAWIKGLHANFQAEQDRIHQRSRLEQARQLAIVDERDRISHALHDSVGHGLSSAIIQCQAARVINKDERLAPALEQLQNTLDRGMTEIREIIHREQRSALDLDTRIHGLLEGLGDRRSVYENHILESPPTPIKYQILSVVREGITNFLKHSNGDQLRIELKDNSRFWMIHIEDNGHPGKHPPSLRPDPHSKKGRSIAHISNRPILPVTDGLGLVSMKESVSRLGGHVNHGFDTGGGGFILHVILPKEGSTTAP